MALTETALMVVEDEYLIAIGLEMALQDAGYIVLEPLPSVEEALTAIGNRIPDLALLDINLGGHRVYPVADVLAARKVPFIFLSGCHDEDLPSRFVDTRRLIKPFQTADLLDLIRLVLGWRPAP